MSACSDSKIPGGEEEALRRFVTYKSRVKFNGSEREPCGLSSTLISSTLTELDIVLQVRVSGCQQILR